MENAARLGRLHQLAVDTYGAQHAGPASIRLPYSLVGLHLALEKGADGLRVRDVHRRMGKPRPWWPAFAPPPSRGDVTVLDVVNEGARRGSPGGHAGAMSRWARSAWEAWRDEHARVAELARRIGAGA